MLLRGTHDIKIHTKKDSRRAQPVKYTINSERQPGKKNAATWRSDRPTPHVPLLSRNTCQVRVSHPVVPIHITTQRYDTLRSFAVRTDRCIPSLDVEDRDADLVSRLQPEVLLVVDKRRWWGLEHQRGDRSAHLSFSAYRAPRPRVRLSTSAVCLSVPSCCCCDRASGSK